MVQVATVQWQATDERGNYVGATSCAIGDTTKVSLQTGILFGDVMIVPRWILLDNLSNGTNVTLTFGPFTYTVARYQREVFKLPGVVSIVTVTVPSDATVAPTLTLASTPDGLNAGSDQFAIQQAANQFVSYPWIAKTAGAAQAASDQNTNIELTNAAAQNYTLRSIVNDAVPNGWLNPMIKNTGAGRWSIVPAAGETINDIWTNANPLRLSRYDQIMLSCDGNRWFATGCISFESAEQTFTSAGALTIAHGLVRTPTILEPVLRNVTANLGYTAGMEIPAQINDDLNAAAGAWVGTMVADATNINIRYSGQAWFAAINNFTTGARAAVTNANWRLVLRARLNI